MPANSKCKDTEATNKLVTSSLSRGYFFLIRFRHLKASIAHFQFLECVSFIRVVFSRSSRQGCLQKCFIILSPNWSSKILYQSEQLPLRMNLPRPGSRLRHSKHWLPAPIPNCSRSASRDVLIQGFIAKVIQSSFPRHSAEETTWGLGACRCWWGKAIQLLI